MGNVRKLRERRRVPLRVGDVWVYLGPATRHKITALEPRPTFQKPWSQAVTLDGGRTITEATLRACFQREQEYRQAMPILARKWARATAEFFGRPLPKAKVVKLRPSDCRSASRGRGRR